MFKNHIREMKSAWKPAIITYLIALTISLLTGLQIELVIVSIFCVVFMSMTMWTVYLYFKNKLNN